MRCAPLAAICAIALQSSAALVLRICTTPACICTYSVWTCTSQSLSSSKASVRPCTPAEANHHLQMASACLAGQGTQQHVTSSPLPYNEAV